jgi:hypothetical protein
MKNGKQRTILLVAGSIAVVAFLYLRQGRPAPAMPEPQPAERTAAASAQRLKPGAGDIEPGVLRSLREEGATVVEADGAAIRRAVSATNVTWLYHAHSGDLVARLADGTYLSGRVADSADILDQAARLTAAGAPVEVITE